jgi:hypothetical protein
MRILHLAVENFAGIPIRLVQEERRLGHESRLITLLSPMQKYEEDIALNLPALNSPVVPFMRTLVRGGKTPKIVNTRHTGSVKYWQPANTFDSVLFKLRDWHWQPSIHKALAKIGGLESFDVIFADGGHDFTRFPHLLAETRVPIVVMYYGSDLRTRGIIAGVQEKASCTFTFEHDHTLLFPEAEFLFYPYEHPIYAPSTTYTPPTSGETIRIGHAPTNRAAKGTDRILAALETLKAEFPLEIVLIERMSHKDALAAKARCHVFIDNVGELGYGLNSIESLMMEIPTAVEIMPDFADFLSIRCAGEGHPFYNVRRASLEDDVRRLFLDTEHWQERGKRGQIWSRQYHSLPAVVQHYLGKVASVMDSPAFAKAKW